jgi:predicted nuclease with TOPRIM domain
MSGDTHQHLARDIVAKWRVSRSRALIRALTGSDVWELVEAFEGALGTVGKETHDSVSVEVDFWRNKNEELEAEIETQKDKMQEQELELAQLKSEIGSLKGEVEDIEAYRPPEPPADGVVTCDTCGGLGYQKFNMEILPCPDCTGKWE